jgi:GxxExxY protein
VNKTFVGSVCFLDCMVHREGARRTRRTTTNTTVALNNRMNEEEIIEIILDEAFYIHKTIGPGMLESIYKTCLAYRLRKRGLIVETEKPVPVIFEEVRMGCGYRTDMVVQQKVVVDTKNITTITDLEIAQLLTYLRNLNFRHGVIVILNFKTVLLKNGIKRVLNGFR